MFTPPTGSFVSAVMPPRATAGSVDAAIPVDVDAVAPGVSTCTREPSMRQLMPSRSVRSRSTATMFSFSSMRGWSATVSRLTTRPPAVVTTSPREMFWPRLPFGGDDRGTIDSALAPPPLRPHHHPSWHSSGPRRRRPLRHRRRCAAGAADR
jgi:hypothetical protein